MSNPLVGPLDLSCLRYKATYLGYLATNSWHLTCAKIGLGSILYVKVVVTL